MKPLLLSSVLFALVLAGCTRDTANSTKTLQKDSARLLLIVDSTFGADSLIVLDSNRFSYDDAGRLLEWMHSSTGGTSYSAQDYLFTRDAHGLVLNVLTKYTDIGHGVVYHFNADKTNEIHYKIGSDQVDFIYQYPPGKTPAHGDSLAIGYTGSNITDSRYFDLTGAAPKDQYVETVWQFDAAGHLTNSITEAEDSEKSILYGYKFEDHINPLKLGVEALFSDPNRMSSGNLTEMTTGEHETGIYLTENWQYSYRSDDRPLRSTYTKSLGYYTKIINYYYSE